MEMFESKIVNITNSEDWIELWHSSFSLIDNIDNNGNIDIRGFTANIVIIVNVVNLRKTRLS